MPLYLLLFTRLIFYHRLNATKCHPQSNLSLFVLVQLLYSCAISRNDTLVSLLMDLRRHNCSESSTFMCPV